MVLTSTQTGRRLRGCLAATLTVWLSGILLLLCCCGTFASPSDDADSCPLAKRQPSIHCDKTRELPDSSSFRSGEPDCMADCGMLPAIFDRSRKIDPVEKYAAEPAIVVADVPVRVQASLVPRPSVWPRLRTPSRRKVYLLNRNLRI